MEDAASERPENSVRFVVVRGKREESSKLKGEGEPRRKQEEKRPCSDAPRRRKNWRGKENSIMVPASPRKTDEMHWTEKIRRTSKEEEEEKKKQSVRI